MTIKEFYQWAKGNNIEDYEPWIAYWSDFYPVDGEVVNDNEKRIYL